jgi:hypothetical protein
MQSRSIFYADVGSIKKEAFATSNAKSIAHVDGAKIAVGSFLKGATGY